MHRSSYLQLSAIGVKLAVMLASGDGASTKSPYKEQPADNLGVSVALFRCNFEEAILKGVV